jgi:predicted CXXCH cytochrome family protein
MQIASTAGARPEAIRSAIVNPARLPATRQMELCMACHLESTSFPLPNALLRYQRGPFSYQPGESLGDFLINFDHAPGTGREDKYEIVNSAYRLRRSACFLKSNGKLTCTTCHNPHAAPRGEAAVRHYDSICRQCHAPHTETGSCIDCHMPKRRTEDVVHAVATDHLIPRRLPPGDLLADRPERHETGALAYRGPVALYYPESLPPTPENELYLAVAQVKQGSNLAQGIPQLRAALEKHQPSRAEFYLELADAYVASGQIEASLPYYRAAVQRNDQFAHGHQKLGTALRRAGQHREAAQSLERATALAPSSPVAWHELGLVYRALGRETDAIAAIGKAIERDPDLSEAHNNLGILWLSRSELARAEASFREAIRIKPDAADARGNLANLLAGAGNFPAAREQFDAALRLRPNDAPTRFNYALLLGRAGRVDDAQRQLESALRSDPRFPEAHELLGDLLLAKDQASAAIPHYRAALQEKPDSTRAHFGLGAALLSTGDKAAARPHLEKAATDPAFRPRAAALLRQIP